MLTKNVPKYFVVKKILKNLKKMELFHEIHQQLLFLYVFVMESRKNQLKNPT